MLDTYIKSTAGTARWLWFNALMFFSPVVKGLLLLFAVGGLVAFLIGVVVQPDHPRAQTALFACLGFGLLGTGLLTTFNMMTERMYFDRMYPDDGELVEEGASWWRKLINWFFVLALLVGFVVAATYTYDFKKYGIENFAIGIVWWLGVGIALGVGRWVYRQAGGMPDAMMVLLRKMREKSRASKQVPAPKVNAANEVDRVVVPFRRRH